MSLNNNLHNRIPDEQMLLVNILNQIYNDNLRQINNCTTTINNLNQINRQIQNTLIQILNNPHRQNNNRQNNNRQNNNRQNNNRQNNNRQNRSSDNTSNSNNGLGRVILNSTPYIIDSIQQYTIPEGQNNNLSQILQSFFQPIDVYPTREQIATATRHVRYCDILSPRNITCPISLDAFNDNEMVTVIRHCGHIFHTEELNTWFTSHCICPVCRYDIRTYNLTNETILPVIT